jgi:imidazoleglycerol-phosphate dehydratase
MENEFIEYTRETKEVKIKVNLRINGRGIFEGSCGTVFMDHMIKTLAKHGRIDIIVDAKGDLKHHIIEDLAICIGKAINSALRNKEGIARFGFAYVPMDEALARAVVDLGGRAYCKLELNVKDNIIEDTKIEDIIHFLETLSQSLEANIHISVLYGFNDHHKIEASIKALAIALREAMKKIGDGIPSTKGVIG